MAAAAGKKKKPQQQEPRTSRKGTVWVDGSSLPTVLAKRGPAQEANRLLKLADMVLGNPKDTPFVERRKKKLPFKGKERRLTR